MTLSFIRRALARKFRISYAQVGEDVVISQVLKRTPRVYVDLGANHPAFGNNTFYFYCRRRFKSGQRRFKSGKALKGGRNTR